MSDKIKLNVTMKYKADSYKQANNLCVVEEIVPIPDADFLEMATFPCRDNPYIALHKGSMFADSEAMHCVLFIAEKQGDGFLVEAEGYDYARYSQYIPHAADIVMGQELHLGNAKRIYDKLENVVADRLRDTMKLSCEHNNFRISYEQFIGVRDIIECVTDCINEITKKNPEFSGISIVPDDRSFSFECSKLAPLRLISPLRLKRYIGNGEDDIEILSTQEFASYADEINEKISYLKRLDPSVHGLMESYDGESSISWKVLSAFPKVEVINGDLVGVTTIDLRSELSKQEMSELKEYIEWQYVAAWGMDIAEHKIRADCFDFYVEFGAADDFQIMTEEEWNQSQGEGLALQQ